MSREAFIRLLEPEPWREHAACVGVPYDVFYPSPKALAESSFAQARQYCAVCPVQAECAEAGRSELYGVWGGTTPRERAGHTLSEKCGRGVRTSDGHGSEAGYMTHRRNGEEPCERCVAAARVKWREREARRRLKAAS